MKKTPLKPRSSKGAAKEKLLAQIKREKLKFQLNYQDFNWCEKCFKPYRREVASQYLDLHHKVLRAHLGEDSHENTGLYCRACHRLEHE